MPYPNSQTPVTIRLNELFSDRVALLTPRVNPGRNSSTNALEDLANRQMPLLLIVRKYGVAQGLFGERHVNDWPSCQQWTARLAMVLALRTGTPIWFDWQTDSSTSVETVLFTNPISVTFHSPLNYPPYWGP